VSRFHALDIILVAEIVTWLPDCLFGCVAQQSMARGDT
jgi:hypothetical protein